MDEPTEPTKKRDHRNYLMRPMHFVDNNGNEYPDAVYSVDIGQFKIEGKNFSIAVSFYKTRDEFDAGLPPISERDGGIRYVNFRSVSFDGFTTVHQEAVAAQAMLLHSIVEAQKTVLNPETGEMESFYKNAGEVLMTDEMRTQFNKDK